jgi:hypothetical protein
VTGPSPRLRGRPGGGAPHGRPALAGVGGLLASHDPRGPRCRRAEFVTWSGGRCVKRRVVCGEGACACGAREARTFIVWGRARNAATKAALQAGAPFVNSPAPGRPGRTPPVNSAVCRAGAERARVARVGGSDPRGLRALAPRPPPALRGCSGWPRQQRRLTLQPRPHKRDPTRTHMIAHARTRHSQHTGTRPRPLSPSYTPLSKLPSHSIPPIPPHPLPEGRHRGDAAGGAGDAVRGGAAGGVQPPRAPHAGCARAGVYFCWLGWLGGLGGCGWVGGLDTRRRGEGRCDVSRQALRFGVWVSGVSGQGVCSRLRPRARAPHAVRRHALQTGAVGPRPRRQEGRRPPAGLPGVERHRLQARPPQARPARVAPARSPHSSHPSTHACPACLGMGLGFCSGGRVGVWGWVGGRGNRRPRAAHLCPRARRLHTAPSPLGRAAPR